MKELPTYQPDFEEYIRQGEPEKKAKAEIWGVAVGLQQVDGLRISDYMRELIRRNIEGEITMADVQRLLDEHYRDKKTCTYQSTYTILPKSSREYANRRFSSRDQRAKEDVQSANVTQNVTENVTENRATTILHLIKENPHISTLELARQLSVTRMTIHRDLERLKSAGLLFRIGPDKGGYWQVKEKD